MSDPTSGADDDRTTELLRQALHEEAELAETDPAALQQIQHRTKRRGSLASTGGRRGWIVGAVSASAAVAAVIAAVVVANQADEPDGTPPAASPSATSEPTATDPTGADPSGEDPIVTEMHDARFDPTSNMVATMYYLGAENPRTGDVFLSTEPHTVDGSSDPVIRVREFLTSYTLDPDYRSGWPEGVDVNDVQLSRRGDPAMIDLFGAADLASGGGLDKQAAQIAVQGLIRTAGINTGNVAFTYNDAPVDTLLGLEIARSGVAVLPDQSGDFSVATRAPIQVTRPVEGEVLTNPVIVTGNGNVFEGNVNWELLDDRGRVLDDGFVTAGFLEWLDFDVALGTLRPGTYTFRAFEVSAENGSETFVDDKTFTVE